MCFARGGVGGVADEWVRGLGLGFTNPRGAGRKWDMCLFLVAVVWLVWWEWVVGLGQSLGGLGGVKSV